MNTGYDAPRPRELSLRGVNVDTGLVTVAYGDATVEIEFGRFKQLVTDGTLEEYVAYTIDGGMLA